MNIMQCINFEFDGATHQLWQTRIHDSCVHLPQTGVLHGVCKRHNCDLFSIFMLYQIIVYISHIKPGT